LPSLCIKKSRGLASLHVQSGRAVILPFLVGGARFGLSGKEHQTPGPSPANIEHAEELHTLIQQIGSSHPPAD